MRLLSLRKFLVTKNLHIERPRNVHYFLFTFNQLYWMRTENLKVKGQNAKMWNRCAMTFLRIPLRTTIRQLLAFYARF